MYGTKKITTSALAAILLFAIPVSAIDLLVGSEQSLGFTGLVQDRTIPVDNPPKLIRFVAYGGDGGSAVIGGNGQCHEAGGQGATA
ncbi:MAG: hypothetical protein ACPGXK_15680, partial [Phycisphaerae bacterium]